MRCSCLCQRRRAAARDPWPYWSCRSDLFGATVFGTACGLGGPPRGQARQIGKGAFVLCVRLCAV